MAKTTVSPTLVAKAENGAQLKLEKKSDPVYQALLRYNNELVLSGSNPTGTEEPVQDDRAYAVAGAPKPFCRPWIKVSWRAGFQPGPEVRFEQRDDGLHLVAAFEEDQARRVSGALPFNVQVKSVRLSYGTGPGDILSFSEPLQEPMDPEKGSAFRIEADALVPLDERRARIVAALQERSGARWLISLEFKWERIVPGSPPPKPTKPPVVIFTPPINPRIVTTRAMGIAAQPEPVERVRPGILQAILKTKIQQQPPPPPTRQVKNYVIDRALTAEYPKDAPENRPIFAAVTGDYVQVGWKNTAHGWFQPTPIQDTVYMLPDAYRLQVDQVTGLPSIQAILLRKSDSGEMSETLDPALFRIRLTFKVRPDFDAERLNSLRTLIRAESTNQVKFADLVIGGYSAARFVPDPSLSGLGELFFGSTAGAQDGINPEEGFTLTFEGKSEFTDLLFQKLRGEGILGAVEFDLQEPGGTLRKMSVPMVLTLRRLAQFPLPSAFNAAAPGAEDADPADLLPRKITLQNPSSRDVTIAGIRAHALQKSPVTGRVDEWFPAGADGAWPATLAPGTSRVVELTLAENALCNAWNIVLVDSRTAAPDDIVLSQIFDAATTGVRGWKVSVDCPPLQFFDQLSADDQARMKDLAAIEVEVRRLGASTVEEVRLTRAGPSGSVLLSRTVADFISDRSTGTSVFEYRQRLIRLTQAEEWTKWKPESGSAVSVFLN